MKENFLFLFLGYRHNFQMALPCPALFHRGVMDVVGFFEYLLHYFPDFSTERIILLKLHINKLSKNSCSIGRDDRYYVSILI